MLIKAGVDISRLKRSIRRALPIIAHMYWLRLSELVITSTWEGTHSAGSLHYSNEAIDIRRPTKDAAKMVGDIKFALGKNFDVILYSDHIHIEYDLK